MSPAPEQPAWVVLGRISGLYGVQGMVKVFSYTENRDGILDYAPWYLGAEHRPVAVLDGRLQGAGVVALLEGVRDREQARLLIGQEIAVPAQALPALEEGEYYWSQLLGLAVENREGQRLGEAAGFLETGANDVLLVRDAAGREHLIPWSDGAILAVERVQGRILVDWQADW